MFSFPFTQSSISIDQGKGASSRCHPDEVVNTGCRSWGPKQWWLGWGSYLFSLSLFSRWVSLLLLGCLPFRGLYVLTITLPHLTECHIKAQANTTLSVHLCRELSTLVGSGWATDRQRRMLRLFSMTSSPPIQRTQTR